MELIHLLEVDAGEVSSVTQLIFPQFWIWVHPGNGILLITASFIIHHVVGPSQLRVVDSGLFALACAFTLCEDNNPARRRFLQASMRVHYNELVTSSLSNLVGNFSHVVMEGIYEDVSTLSSHRLTCKKNWFIRIKIL